MIPRYRKQIALVRAMGIDVFILPGLPGMPPSGEAYTEGGRAFINVTCNLNSTKFIYVLFHELGHHVLGHVGVFTTTPDWITEKAADDFALFMLLGTMPAAIIGCEKLAKENVRLYLQPMIDAEIWHHVDLETARWADCEISPETEATLNEVNGCRDDLAAETVVF